MNFLKLKTNDVIKIDTLIGKKAQITGEITGGGNYKIDGKIEGNISIIGDLIIGDKAVITGDIIAKNAVVAGELNGNITVTGQLSIKKTAKVTGQHKSGSLIVEEGSIFTGNCEILGESQRPKEENIEISQSME